MDNILLYGHGGSGNHGCEAIVRSTVQILRNKTKYTNPIVASLDSEQDIHYGLGTICTIEDVSKGKRNWAFWRAYINLKLTGSYEALDSYLLATLIKKYKKTSIALSIGGDNYCYGKNSVLAYQNELLNHAGIKTVLWGCSIEENVLNNEKGYNDICKYSLIIARESFSYSALKNAKVPNVYLIPDPAFNLPLKNVDLPISNCVGVNISPMIMNYECSKGGVFENYKLLIDNILTTTNMNVLLIPHVVWSQSDDRMPLFELYNSFKHTNRIYIIEDNGAEYLKGVISKCRFMIAARTHASIAAYSTCVPTLVVGYSVKAKGIAKDIFGTYENYVLPVQQLSSPDELTKNFQWLMANENSIRLHLQDFMPDYIEKTWQAGQILQNI